MCRIVHSELKAAYARLAWSRLTGGPWPLAQHRYAPWSVERVFWMSDVTSSRSLDRSVSGNDPKYVRGPGLVMARRHLASGKLATWHC